MLVHFVGSGDAFGSGGRAQTCISLRAGAEHLLVDCGTTSLAALKTHGIDPGTVAGVVITHLHGDHFGGLPFLVLDGQFRRRTEPLVVLGPPGTEARLRAAMEALFPGSSTASRRFAVEVHELVPDGTPATLGDAVVRGWEVDHACGAPPLAVQVQVGGVAFGYSGDTAWTPALTNAAQGAHLFAVEAYTFDTPMRYHLDYATVREHAGEMAAQRLVLTHMSQAMLERLDPGGRWRIYAPHGLGLPDSVPHARPLFDKPVSSTGQLPAASWASIRARWSCSAAGSARNPTQAAWPAPRALPASSSSPARVSAASTMEAGSSASAGVPAASTATNAAGNAHHRVRPNMAAHPDRPS